jgi:hypothetical protein
VLQRALAVDIEVLLLVELEDAVVAVGHEYAVDDAAFA